MGRKVIRSRIFRIVVVLLLLGAITAVLYFMELISFGSDEAEYTPRPKGYNHIELPEPKYVGIQDAEAPYFFEYSQYATISDDTVGLSEKFWKKLYYKDYKSEVDITYKAINKSPERLDSLIRDSYKLVDKHNVRATGSKVEELTLDNGKTATVFHIKGEVPTTYQFFIHDSTNHFIRCSLYFPTALKNDSLRPIIDYCIDDMRHMMNTLVWR